MAKRATHPREFLEFLEENGDLPLSDPNFLHLAGTTLTLDDLPWLGALEIADEGDKEVLQNMLLACQTEERAHELPSPLMIFFIGDWMSRHEFKKKRGGQQTPAYATTRDERRLMLAKARVRELVESGETVDNAVDAVAKERSIAATTLSAFYKGHHGGERRAARRRKGKRATR